MSLFRTAVIVGVAIALLPSDKGKQQQLYAQAMTLSQDAMTYCDRNAETCTKAADAWAAFKVKAAFAGEIVMEAIQRYSAGPDAARHDGEIAADAAAEQRPAPVSDTRGTLTDRDLAPAWRGSKGQQRL